MRRMAFALLLLAAAATARAEDVRLRHGGLTLSGELAGPMAGEVVLLVRGTLPHGRQVLPPRVATARAMAPDEVPTAPFQYGRGARVAAASCLDHDADEEEARSPAVLGRSETPGPVAAPGGDRLFPDLAADAAPYASGRLTLVTTDGADRFFQDLFAEDPVDAVADYARAL